MHAVRSHLQPQRPLRRFKLTPERRRQMWPLIFTREVPYALPMCRWAAREGAFVNPAIMMKRDAEAGNFVVATRSLPRGAPLMSIPLSLAIATSPLDRSPGIETPMDQLLHIIARGLHDQTCPWYKYLQFLHDSYNDDDLCELADRRLEDELDALLDGNALNIVGVANAPFIDKRALKTVPNRFAVDKAMVTVRHAKQAVPYFASSSVGWALSMAMSRSSEDEDGELTIFPLIDLCNHSFHPSAHYYISEPPERQQRRYESTNQVASRGVAGWNEKESHVHLLAIRNIAAGEQITLLYDEACPHDEAQGEDVRQRIAERWQVQWGFVPNDDRWGAATKRTIRRSGGRGHRPAHPDTSSTFPLHTREGVLKAMQGLLERKR